MSESQYDPEDLILVVEHPFGRVEVTLAEWIEHGPPHRPLLSPEGVRSRVTGEELPLTVIPIQFRNDAESRRLIVDAGIESPWRTVKLQIPFVHEDESGVIDVTLEQPVDPTQYGQPAELRGFPMCTAVVDHPAQGYRAMLGWVQLVSSSDYSSREVGFQIDPFILFADAPSPYAFYGVKPTLFDAPARTERRELSWAAHSFLAHTPLDVPERPVTPLAGFAWGFLIDPDGAVALQRPLTLTAASWDAHLDYLRDTYPAWAFLRADSRTFGQSRSGV